MFSVRLIRSVVDCASRPSIDHRQLILVKFLQVRQAAARGAQQPFAAVVYVCHCETTWMRQTWVHETARTQTPTLPAFAGPMAGRFGPNVLTSLVLILLDIGAWLVLVSAPRAVIQAVANIFFVWIRMGLRAGF